MVVTLRLGKKGRMGLNARPKGQDLRLIDVLPAFARCRQVFVQDAGLLFPVPLDIVFKIKFSFWQSYAASPY